MRKLSLTSTTSSVDFNFLGVHVLSMDVPPPVIKKLIRINGKIGENSTCFTCAFSSWENRNIPFLMFVNLEERFISRCCMVNGYWSEEEKTSWCKFTLKPDKEFRLEVYVTPEEFLVSVDEMHFCAFAHRMTLQQIKGFSIYGNVKVTSTESLTLPHYPEISTGYYVSNDVDFDPEKPRMKNLPYQGLFKRKFKSGRQLEIYGRVKIYPNSFFINLQDDIQLYPLPLIPFHLRASFDTFTRKNTLTMNARNENGWRQEKKTETSPFSPGYSFCAVIKRTETHMSLWVNKKLAGMYDFNIIPKDTPTNFIFIHGDVIIYHVNMRNSIKEVEWINKLESKNVL